MRTMVIPFLSLLVLAGVARADDPVDAKKLIQMFAERDLDGLQRTSPKVLENFPPEQRNEVALAAAKALDIKDYIGAIGKDDIHKHFAGRAQDTPAEAECRRQWGINMAAAEMLRF